MAGATRAVFLSYRREDTRHIAGRLTDRLVERWGQEQIFMDVDTLEPGADFAAVIAREVASCNILIALIGPTWSTITGQRGRRRLDDPDDFVVLEIQAALERGIHVIPVLVDGAVMPDRGDLPEGLQGLARRNTVRLDHATFRSDLTTLLNAVDRILSTPAQKITEPTVGADADVADQAITTPKEPPQRAAKSDSEGKVAGAHHPSLSASPTTPLTPTPWLRLRPRLFITTLIVITLAVAGSIVLLTTIKRGPAVPVPDVIVPVPDVNRNRVTTGDWDGDGTMTPGVVRKAEKGNWDWRLRNSNKEGSADVSVGYGHAATDAPVVGDWDGNGTMTPGWFAASAATGLGYCTINSWPGKRSLNSATAT